MTVASAQARSADVAAFAVRQNQVSQRARSRLVRFLFQILLLDPFVLNVRCTKGTVGDGCCMALTALLLPRVVRCQSWRQCNQVLGLRVNDVTALFLEWFFSVPVGDLLCTPASASSSGLRRWLQQLLCGDIGAPPPASPTGRARTRTPSGGTVSEASGAPVWTAEAALFERCLNADELEHALLLATFCAGMALSGAGAAGQACV